MKILLTGGSSFTGMWFIKELVHKGHQVTTTFSRPRGYYNGLRLARIKEFTDHVESVYECPFGSESFLKLANRQFDLICHHGADVTNYRDPSFNVAAAVLNNTNHIYDFMVKLKEGGCHKILLTGSLFEPGEGGAKTNPAISPYGLSKGITSEVFQYYCGINELKLGKFVISNPFGPFEEKKLSYALMEAWHKHQLPTIKTPLYIRDNIHVSLLAKVYAKFAESLTDEPGYVKIAPAGYIESLKNFTDRMATEMRHRLPWECEYEVVEQQIFSEPEIRINNDAVEVSTIKWDEVRAWNDMASYYDQLFNG